MKKASKANSAAERQQEILTHLIEVGSSSIDDLAHKFDVSLMTVHRDLTTLSLQGMVVKHHGSVSIHSSNVFESNFEFRSLLAVEEKKRLAAVGAQEVHSGESVLLDDSTTASFLAPLLADLEPLTVITNGLSSIEQLKTLPGIRLITLGGEYYPKFNASFGLLCEQTIQNLKVDIAILSASAVDGIEAYVQDPAVTQIKRAMLNAARRTVLLVHSGKFGKTALHRLASLTDFDLVLIDHGLSAEHQRLLEEAGVNFRQVE